MTRSSFLIPQNPYPSTPFLNWSRAREGLFREEQPGYLFTMARYALYQGLRASGVVPGDEILIPAYICDAAVEAVHAFGAAPVFYRITRECSIDLEDIQSRISARTRALLFVHYFGFAEKQKALREFADNHKLLLIEDCAHVLAGQNDGRPLGSIGDFSIFSWRKFLPVLDGAQLRFNSAHSAQAPQRRNESLLFDLKALKYLLDMRLAGGKHGFARTLLDLPVRLFRSLQGTSSLVRGSQVRQTSDVLKLDGGSSRFNPRVADSAISRVSRYVLTHSDIDAITAQRRKNYTGLIERLSLVSGISPLHAHLPEGTCPLQLPIFVRDVPGAHRLLRQQGIPATAWDGVRPSAVSDSAFPDAAFLYDNLIFLPVHQNLCDRDLDMIAETVTKISAGAAGRMRGGGVKIEATQLLTKQ